ncbi:MAG: hypothetical protein D6748_12550 [Calditrichaeota bacterium]|nr:MAG: hypothetical protein D6748_12550 [Calditrichota bacterium]
MTNRILLLVLLMVGRVGFSQVILTEVMFNPSGPESSDEFVEIYNAGTQAVDLTGWQIGDSTGFDVIVEVAGNGLLLQPGQYGLILDPDYFDDGSTTYDSLIPPQALVMTINGSTLGSAGLSNSTPETILLIDANLDTLQRYRYSIDNPPGHSDEKIELTPNNSPSNWANSVAEHGTPGFQNSVSPMPVDGAITHFHFTSNVFIVGNSIPFEFTVNNVGINPITELTWLTFLDEDENGLPDPSEILETFTDSLHLSPGDSLIVEGEYSGISYGEHHFGVSLRIPEDERAENDVAIAVRFMEDPQVVQVVINEIMFEPRSGQEEWVELYHKGSQAIDLRYLFFTDTRDTVRVGTGNEDQLQPGDYLILCGDSALLEQYPISPEKVRVNPGFPTLNNDGDQLKLIGPTGFTYDQVPYRQDWYGREVDPGTSLEKLHPSLNGQMGANWAASVSPEGATPGRQNSVFVNMLPTNNELEIQPNPFSPDNDGFDDVTVIRFTLEVETALVNVRIYDLRGRLIRYLAESLPVAHQGQLIWDGKDDAGRIAPIGPYICLFEALNPEKRTLKTLKKTIILMKR